VGPALENHFNVYGMLRNELPSLLEQHAAAAAAKTEPEQQNEDQADDVAKDKENNDKKDDDNDDDEETMLEDITELLLGKNLWRQRAEQDPESLEAALLNMTTDTCFNYFFYSNKLGLFRPNSSSRSSSSLSSSSSLFSSSSPFFVSEEDNHPSTKQFHSSFRYVPGSFTVNEVALLRARAVYLHPKEEQGDSNNEYPEFQASDVREESIPIAAQIDVLYEATHTYELEQKEEEEEEEKNGGTTGGKQEQVTNLGVAIFEGWIRSSSRSRAPQWKVAMLREALEFPFSSPTVT